MNTTLLLFTALALTPQVDREAGARYYGELQAHLKTARSAAGTFEVRHLDRTEVWHFKFLRPNFVKLTSKEFRYVQDGNNLYGYSPLDNTYEQSKAPAEGLGKGMAFNLGAVLGLENFLFGDDFRVTPGVGGLATFQGAPCRTVTLTSKSAKDFQGRLMLDGKTGMPLGWVVKMKGYDAAGTFKRFVLDAPLTKSEFIWTVPDGAKKAGG